MESQVFYSFVCKNEQPKSRLQLVLYNCEKRDDQIIQKSYNPFGDIERFKNKDTKLKNIHETLKKLNSYYEKEDRVLTNEEINKKVQLEFTKAVIKAKDEGYLTDLLNFHLKEFTGNKNDFLDHLTQRNHKFLSALHIWIEIQREQINNSDFVTLKSDSKAKKNEFDSIEKLMIIQLLQEIGLFPSQTGQTKQKHINELVSALTDISVIQVQKIRDNEINPLFLSKEKLHTRSIPYKLANLNKIKPVIENLNNALLTKRFNDFESKIAAKIEKSET